MTSASATTPLIGMLLYPFGLWYMVGAIVLTRPRATGTLHQAPVQVAFTTRVVRSVLAVSVGALLADGGGPTLRPAGGAGGHPRPLQRVTVGLVDDSRGLVQVGGPALYAGQRIELPAVRGEAGAG